MSLLMEIGEQRPESNTDGYAEFYTHNEMLEFEQKLDESVTWKIRNMFFTLEYSERYDQHTLILQVFYTVY